MDQKFYVYILELADNTLYTGYTKDVEKRLGQHANRKGSKYVRARLPFTLRYLEGYENRSEAMKREISIKKLRRKYKLRLVENYWESSNLGNNGILGSTTL